MDNERPNERTLWSSRLEEPGALPGTGLTDKEAAWDKLYDRLRESEEAPRRKRMIWLWAAAACLLLLVIPAALLLKDGHKGSRQVVKRTPVAITPGDEHTTPQVQPSNPDKDIAHTRPGAPENAVPLPPTSGQQVRSTFGQQARSMSDQHARPTSAQQAGSTPDQQAHSSPRQLTHPTRPTMTRPDLNRLLAHSADTLTLVFARPDLSKPLTVAATAPPKKAPRVVHINELEPPQPTPATVNGQRRRPGALHVELTPEEPFRPSTTYAEPAAHPILSFKHAQNP